MAELTQEEMNILAYTLLGEAAGEGTKGMEAVMWTIMNRANSGRYPTNPALVATQKNKKGVHQYSTWNKKSLGGNSPDTRFSTQSPQFKEALQVVERVMAGESSDPTGGATHFYAGPNKPAWFDAEGPAGEIKIGRHRFAARNTAADAATLLATGRIQERPTGPQQNPIAEGNASVGGGGGLTTRVVETITVDSRGNPQIRLNSGSPRSTTVPSRQPVITRQVSSEPVRLSQLRSDPRNAQDLAGAAARTVTSNPASANKTSRNTGGDKTGQAARTSTTNAAAANKVARYTPPVKPAVVAQNKTPQQIAQEADNARLSGYRAIQEMGPSSKGAKPVTQINPAARPPSGLTRTAGTTVGGRAVPQAATTAIPRGVTPEIPRILPAAPKPVVRSTSTLTKQQVEKATPFTLPASAPRIQPQPELKLPKTTMNTDVAAGLRVGANAPRGAVRAAMLKKTELAPRGPVAGALAPPVPLAPIERVPVVKKVAPAPLYRPRPVVPQLTPTQLMVQQMRGSADYTEAHISAIERNAGMYSPFNGAYVPTEAPGKKPRRSYGDSSFLGAGGSLVGR